MASTNMEPQPAGRGAPTAYLAGILLALLAFALRAWGLAAQSLWSDEDITLDRARLPLGTLLGTLPVEHTPGYFVMMRAWTQVAGDGDLALRWPSLAAGVLTVLLGAYLAGRLIGRRAGWLAGLVLAVNPFLIWYGQEARMYTLLGAAALGALAAVLRAESSRRPWRWWAAAGVLAASTVYLHYYGFLVLLALAAWALLDLARFGRRTLPGWSLAGAVAALLLLPWLPRTWAALAFPGGRAFLFEGGALAVARAWSAGTTLRPEWAIPVTWLYVLLAGLGCATLLYTALRSASVGAWRALLYLALPLTALTLMSLKTGDFHPRYAFAALPAFYLAVAAGAAALPRPLPVLAGALLVLGALPALMGLHGDARYQKQDYRGFLRTVEAAAGHENTVLFLDGPSLGLARRYEMDRSPVKIVNIRAGQAEPPPERVAERARELADEYPQLWLAENGEANGDIRRWLDAEACHVDSQAFQDLILSRYYVAPPGAALMDWRRGGDPVPAGEPSAAPADEVGEAGPGTGTGESGEPRTLRLRWQVPPTVAAGEILPVRLDWWLPVEGLEAVPKLSLRLSPASDPGRPVVSLDRWAPVVDGAVVDGETEQQAGAARRDCSALAVPAAAAPGDYRLDFILYEAETGRELRRLSESLTVVAAP